MKAQKKDLTLFNFGKGFVSFVIVAKNIVKSGKKQWPNQFEKCRLDNGLAKRFCAVCVHIYTLNGFTTVLSLRITPMQGKVGHSVCTLLFNA